MMDTLPCDYCGKMFDKSIMRVFDSDRETNPEYLCDTCYAELKELCL